MSYLPPIFQQDNQYSARVFRQLLDTVGTEGVVGSSDFEVTERGAGAAMAVDVAPGKAFVVGDDQSSQGTYLVAVESTVEVPIAPADSVDPRVDLIVAQVRDSNAGGPSGDDWLFRAVEGTPDPSPVAPAVPDSAIVLAEVAVAALATSILDANITDVRTFAEAPLAPLPPLPALDDLTDVSALSPSSWDVLRFNSTSVEWENGDGANIANLNAGNLASGTVPTARVSGSYTGITGTGSLNAGSITSGFGNVDIGTSTFTGGGVSTTSVTLTASNSSYSIPSAARKPGVRVVLVGGGGGGGRSSGTAGAGGTTTFNAGTAGTQSASGGAAGDGSGNLGATGGAGWRAGNGGQNFHSSSQNTRGDGQGGQVRVVYFNLTGITTANVTVGAGGAGGDSSAGSGGRGEVILEY
jgi:hypothetical protein